jgi:release factor glutamine methyltransferase
VLLAAATGVDRAAALTRPETVVPAPAARVYATLLQRRAAREPLAYVVGYKEFWSLEFEVSPAVLIPRPETELLVEIALELVKDPPSVSPSICDVGTGSGCIAIALARELAHASIVAVDQSAAALEVARRNAVKHAVADRIELVAADLFGAIRSRRFDLVVTNPPYVAAEDLADLEPELRWEPDSALNGGAGGLNIIRRLLAETAAALVPKGWVVMEIGAQQRDAVEALAVECGFTNCRVRLDYAGLPSLLVAQAGRGQNG